MPQIRRTHYHPSLASSDYFMVKHVGDFVLTKLSECIKPDMEVLDVGCGEQPLRATIESLGGRYQSTDIEQNHAGTVDHLCPIISLPLPTDSVDLILCSEVMEHVPETEEAIAEMTRVLKPGGLLILTTPFNYLLHEQPYDFVRLTPHQLKRCAGLSGLEILEIKQAGNALEVFVSMFSYASAWFFNATTNRPLRWLYSKAMQGGQALANIATCAVRPAIGRFLLTTAYLSNQCVMRKKTPSPILPSSTASDS
ncbi:class I SAM-dependent methyltransferase [Phragmitibacter flavus]|nr:class I SAM-dependent methyltransferase [Phragmitibacter flavus]